MDTRQIGVILPGDHVKFEYKEPSTGESEWMWLKVNHCDEENRVVFGCLDSEPIVAAKLKVGQELAVSYEHIRDHRRFAQA
jgi:hypothetical protein